MESLVGKTVRLEPTEWDGVDALARSFSLESAVFVRAVIRHVLRIAGAPGMREASLGVLAATVGGSFGFSQNLGVLGGSPSSRRRDRA